MEDKQRELRYCPKCKEILFRWNDEIVEYSSQERYIHPDNNYIEYGDVEPYDSNKTGESCNNGHKIVVIIIPTKSLRKIYDDKKDGVKITIPKEHHESEISEEDFETILLESGIANLSGEK